MAAGATLASGIDFLSGPTTSSSIGNVIGGGVGNVAGGGKFFARWGTAFAIDLASSWATGITNREFNTDGTISYKKYDEKGNRNVIPLRDGTVIGLVSDSTGPDSFIDYLWSTLVGGYSHVTTVRNGRIEQFGDVADPGTYSGRTYKVLATSQSFNVVRSDLNGDYSYISNNCATTCSLGLNIPRQWSPYNVYSYFNYPQFGNFYYPR